MLYSGGTENSFISLIDLRGPSTKNTLKGHKSAVKSLKWSTTNGYELVSSSEDKLCVHDLRNPSKVMDVPDVSPSSSLLFSKEYLISIGNNKIHVLNSRNFSKIFQISTENVGFGASEASVYSCDEKTLFFVPKRNGGIGIYEIDERKELNQLNGHFGMNITC